MWFLLADCNSWLQISPFPSTGFVASECWERSLCTLDRCHTLSMSRWFQKLSSRQGPAFVFFSHSPVKKGKHSSLCSSFALQDPRRTVVLLLTTKRLQNVCTETSPQMRGFSLKDRICSARAVSSPYCYIFTPLALYLLSSCSCLPLALNSSLQKVVLVKLVLFRIKFQWLDKTLTREQECRRVEIIFSSVPAACSKYEGIQKWKGVCPLWVSRKKKTLSSHLPFPTVS